jgi:hypothetical protein
VTWLTAEEGGRVSGPPRPTPERGFYATTTFVPPHTFESTQASFVVRGFDPELMTSSAGARWLVPGLGDCQTIEPGAVVVVTEGADGGALPRRGRRRRLNSVPLMDRSSCSWSSAGVQELEQRSRSRGGQTAGGN